MRGGSRQRPALNLDDILRKNDQITVREQDMPKKRKEIPEAARLRKQLERGQLERKFETLWIQCGGRHDDWRKIWIPGYPGYEEKLEIDFYNEQRKVGVEVNGGQFMDIGGHNSPKGLGRDARKQFRCNEMGIMLFSPPTDMVTAEWVEKIFKIFNRTVEVR